MSEISCGLMNDNEEAAGVMYYLWIEHRHNFLDKGRDSYYMSATLGDTERKRDIMSRASEYVPLCIEDD